MKFKKIGHYAKEFGKYVSEPFYSIKNPQADVVRSYYGPIVRDFLIISSAHLASIALTGKPLDLGEKLGIGAQIALPIFDGMIEGMAKSLYVYKFGKKEDYSKSV